MSPQVRGLRRQATTSGPAHQTTLPVVNAHPDRSETSANRPARLIAAGACAVQALVLVGLCVLYLYELVAGQGDDPVRVLMSAILIAVFAAGLAALTRAWLGGLDWARTPTLVWNLLLLPVAWGLHQGGQDLVAAGVGGLGIVGLVSSVAVKGRD